MIKRLKALVNWLESRFPEKVVVNAEVYAITAATVEAHAGLLGEISVRLSTLERSAVHKEAIQDLIAIVKALKDDVTAMKANLGWQKQPVANDELQAMLNGEMI